MRVGVIGAGAWGKNLVSNFAKLGHLVAVADGLEENLERARQEAPEAAMYTTHSELLEQGCDAVAIATPAHTHYQIAKEAIISGCDVFIEKPITLDPDQAQALVDLARQYDKIVMVGHLLLYQPAIEYLKAAIERGDIGEIYTLHQRRSKLGRARSVENVLWSFGVHDVAVLLYLANQRPVETDVYGHCGVQRLCQM